MKRLVVVLLVVITLAARPVAAAQEGGQVCTPEYVRERVSRAYEEYRVAQANARTPEAAMRQVEAFREALGGILEFCASMEGAGDPSGDRGPGSGTLNDPYVFGVAGDTGEGFTIQVLSLVRPADREIQRENMFNPRPGADEVYIIVNLRVACVSAPRCETNYFRFELVGDAGVVYDSPFLVLSNQLDVNLFTGGVTEGRLAFLVRRTDSNLRLLYRPNMFRDHVVAYAIEPSAGSGIQITAGSTVNIRTRPSTDSSVVGRLTAGQSVIAYGRNANGTWLRIADGWVFAELVTTSGGISSLPETTD
jgi:hypothetical protein